MPTLAEKVQEPQFSGLADWEIVEILCSPDPEFPKNIVHTRIGAGTIMSALGAIAGANFLDRMTALATTVPSVKWALKIIDRGDFDVGEPTTRNQIDAMVSGGLLTQEEASAIKSLAETEHQSWSQYYGIKVDSRSVGLARGGI